jgi:eukaryotic-like serine/threonine-protein kinase
MTHPAASTDAEPAPPPIPDIDLVRRIGQGGFGEVWLGVNRATGGLKAVKIVPLARGGRTIDPAGREVGSLAQLESQRIARHPNLIDIWHVGRTADVLFTLMDPADDASGRPASTDPAYRPATLALRLEQGPLAADECVRCARQLSAGLAHLHAAGMVHRDVKPSNCLFVGRDLKLADFGLLTPVSSQLSRLGTVRYMPPDGRMDLRADVYAAGLVIYEMLTGLPADAFPRLGDRAREIAADPRLAHLNRVALMAANRDHHARPAHAGELLAALEAEPTLPARRRVTPQSIAAAAGLATALGIAAILLTTSGRSNRPATTTMPTVAAPPRLAPTPEPVPPVAVAVNFITEPLEAEVMIDGTPARGPDGRPLTTPFTASVPPGRHRVAFVHPRRGPLDGGTVDFDATREVVARWP